MQISGWKKWALGLVGALAVNAIWDYIAKPGTQWVFRAFLTVVTFGSTSLKDVVYRQAAKGLHEEASVSLLFFVTFNAVMILAGWLAFDLLQMRFMVAKSRKALVDLQEVEAGISNPEEPAEVSSIGAKIERVKTEVKRSIDRDEKRVRIFTALSVIMVLLYGINQLGHFMEITESNSATTFYRQSMAICRPYVSDHDSQMLDSRFASIQGRADYIKISDDLHKIADMNHLKLPQFSPW